MKIRELPENVFFIKNEENGEIRFDISLNGGHYPSIKDAEAMGKAFDFFLQYLKKRGNLWIKRENKKTDTDWAKEMDRLNNSCGEKTTQERVKKQGFIYILKSNGLHKIGKTLDTQARFKTYRTENPHETEIIFFKEVSDYSGIEKDILSKYKKKSIRGEWHKFEENEVREIISYLNKL
jgi:hypothetical protein